MEQDDFMVKHLLYFYETGMIKVYLMIFLITVMSFNLFDDKDRYLNGKFSF